MTLIRSRSARGFYCTGIKPAARWHNGVETNVILDMLEERRFIYFCLNGGSIFFWLEYFYINIQNGMALCNGIIILLFLCYMLKYVSGFAALV